MPSSPGERLVELDERDYRIALTRARATLAQAAARLEEELALADQARVEWRQLGRRGEPSALTLREPQLAAARAERDAAAAELERAELDLERTRVTAPYAGRVLERAVDPGQFVNRGAVLGRIHAIDSVEVRLPFGSRQQAFLALPSDGTAAADAPVVRPAVTLEARVGDGTRTWRGELVRVEGIDEATGQLHVVARVEGPWANPAAPLRVGQYVEARVAGRVLEDAFVVPRSALREGREVLLVDAAGDVAAVEPDAALTADGESEAGRVVDAVTTAAGTELLAVVRIGVDPASLRLSGRSLEALPLPYAPTGARHRRRGGVGGWRHAPSD